MQKQPKSIEQTTTKMRTKIFHLAEVVIVFLLMVFLFHYFQSIPLAEKWSSSMGGLPFPGYAVLLIASVSVFFFRCPHQARQLRTVSFNRHLGIIGQTFIPFFVLSVALSWINWQNWGGAILISIIEIGLLIWIASTVKDNQPPAKKASLINGMIVTPILFLSASKIGDVIISIIYFYIFVAFSEEILFRGYIQTRLNMAFGHSATVFGVQVGWGSLISAILFGFWHLGLAMGELRWPHVLWTFFAGLIFAFVREKSESILAPTILHGIMNYGPQAILFYLFWR